LARFEPVVAMARALPDLICEIEEIGVAMKDASICGLGQTAYSAIQSAVTRLHLFDGTATP